ncbi:acrB/AcrD/AcrF family protein, partial [Vibrio parahaemolyticus VPTS-2010]
SGRWTTRVKH